MAKINSQVVAKGSGVDEIKINPDVLVNSSTLLTNEIANIQSTVTGYIVTNESSYLKKLVSEKEELSDYLSTSIIEEGNYIANLIANTATVLQETDENISKGMVN